MKSSKHKKRADRRMDLSVQISFPDKRPPNWRHVSKLLRRAAHLFPAGSENQRAEAVRLVGNYIARCMGKPKVSFTEKP